MTHTVEFKVGEKLFIPRIYSNGEHTHAVILSIGRKYAKAVSQTHYQTEDEKEMTFNIDLKTFETTTTGSHTRKVYQSEEQFIQIQEAHKVAVAKLAKLKEVKWHNVDPAKIDKILAILEG